MCGALSVKVFALLGGIVYRAGELRFENGNSVGIKLEVAGVLGSSIFYFGLCVRLQRRECRRNQRASKVS